MTNLIGFEKPVRFYFGDWLGSVELLDNDRFVILGYTRPVEIGNRWDLFSGVRVSHDMPAMSLMKAYFHSGQPGAALRQYQEYAGTLLQELGAFPSPEITRLYEAIKTGQLPAE